MSVEDVNPYITRGIFGISGKKDRVRFVSSRKRKTMIMTVAVLCFSASAYFFFSGIIGERESVVLGSLLALLGVISLLHFVELTRAWAEIDFMSGEYGLRTGIWRSVKTGRLDLSNPSENIKRSSLGLICKTKDGGRSIVSGDNIIFPNWLIFG